YEDLINDAIPIIEVGDVIVDAVADPEAVGQLERTGNADVSREVTGPVLVSGLAETRFEQDRQHSLRSTPRHIGELHTRAPVIDIPAPTFRRGALAVDECRPLGREVVPYLG